MFISLIASTRNASIAVRTLHTILNMNIICIKSDNRIEINFVTDNQVEKNRILLKKMKSSDRVLMLDYGISLDIESIKKVFSKFEHGYSVQIFPCVSENIDWEMFKTKIKNNSTEPTHQMGMNFDTEVSRKISDDNYVVKKTAPRAWVAESKQLLRSIKDKKGETIKLPNTNEDLFEMLLSKNVKMYAFTAAKPIISYQHECIGNIIESANVNKACAR